MATTANLGIFSIWALISWLVVVVGLFTTNPTTIGPMGVTLWFILLLSAMATLFTIVLYFLKKVLQIEQVRALRLQTSWRQGGLVALYLTILLALQSLRQLALRDVLLLGAIFLCSEVFIRFRLGVNHE